jgi:hypothetical protein
MGRKWGKCMLGRTDRQTDEAQWHRRFPCLWRMSDDDSWPPSAMEAAENRQLPSRAT